LTQLSFVLLFAGLIFTVLGLLVGMLRRRAGIIPVLFSLAACVTFAVSTVNTVLHGEANAQTIGIQAIIGIIIFLVSLIIAVRELRRPDYSSQQSVGLLYAGVGLFSAVCAVMLPVIPLQFNWEPPTLPLPSMTLSPTSAPIRTLITATSAATNTFTPTPIPSLTPTPTFTVIPTRTIPTATPTLRVSCEATTRENVNLRSGAGTEFQRLTTISQGVRVQVEGRTENTSGEWLRIRYEDQRGWISAQFAVLDDECGDQVPTITP
jgi:hypothetical protein